MCIGLSVSDIQNCIADIQNDHFGYLQSGAWPRVGWGGRCPPRDNPCPPFVNLMKTGEKNVYELRYCNLMDVQLRRE